nr:GNAT family N-acetyltransferase [bacterium]
MARSVFGLSFEQWYQKGYWTPRYIPYALMEGSRVVANISVNVIDTCRQGEKKRYVQLGTVMTHPAYRHQGLARRLMGEVLHDWRQACDAIYLYANDTVLDFYPKFGFVRACEYQYSKAITPNPAPVRRMDMQNPADIAHLKALYAQSNPFSALPMPDNIGLVMFYLDGMLRDCVYEVVGQEAIVIASFEGKEMTCHDIFCREGSALDPLLAAVAPCDTRRVALGFTPKDTNGYDVRPIGGEDDALFVLAGKDNPFAGQRVMMPLLSHA